MKLDQTKPYATIHGCERGRRYQQGEQFFTQSGDLWVAPPEAESEVVSREELKNAEAKAKAEAEAGLEARIAEAVKAAKDEAAAEIDSKIAAAVAAAVASARGGSK